MNRSELMEAANIGLILGGINIIILFGLLLLTKSMGATKE